MACHAPTLNNMTRFNPDIHRRRSVRLKDYDYSKAGAYFVTVCVQHRECLFGSVSNGEMLLNDAGRMIKAIWEELPERFKILQLDQFIVMSNHFHGIIILNDCRGESCIRPDVVNVSGVADGTGTKGDHKDRPYGTVDNSLGRIIQAFKSLTTHAYVNGVNNLDWPTFPGRLWQRNYYEHIIRNEDELTRARQYIINNPLKWELDEENPANAFLQKEA